MPLRSDLFSGSKALQACLNSDAAHVVPGARGEHVALIQSALVRLGALDIEGARAEAKFYGPRTAAAVLAYKQEFNVVNRNYQDSKFCKDLVNVHGARDSFREIVKQGPGLHICIAEPAVRSTTSCDLHIDQVQQGQVCSKGSCVPLLNGQTIEHLRTVGPWLAKKAGKLIPF